MVVEAIVFVAKFRNSNFTEIITLQVGVQAH